MFRSNYFFYFLSFLEGASVMAAELLGAKMLAPYFGTSLYVWSSVLAVTLGGLAMGYFAGGIFSDLPSRSAMAKQGKKNTERNLYYILLASAVFLIVMPVMAKEVMIHTAGFSLIASIVISSLIFLFPPVFFMGMVSPMIIQCITSTPSLLPREKGERDEVENSGKAAGTVYGISTLGGILSTFLLGFYIIPVFGLTKPAIVMGIVLGVIPFVKLITAKKFFSLIFPLVTLVPIAIGIEGSLSSSKIAAENSDVKILYSSEGLLGQIIVADYPLYEGEKKIEGSQRILFVNRSTQTIVTTKNEKKSFFEYVNLISEKTAPHPSLPSPRGEWMPACRTGRGERQKALVLGLGGGSVVNELVKNGFQVDAVELDERIAGVAKQYFDLDPKANVHIDDARHFIISHKSQVRSQKFDVIVLDAFIGETNPHHLFTTEFFLQVQSLLADSGIFFINGNGYWKGTAGKGMRSVCKTLISSGFDVEVCPTGDVEDYRNLVFIAKKNKGTGAEGRVSGEKISDLNLQDAVVLVDDKPQLEILNAEANKRWREGCMKYFLSGYYSGQDQLLFK